MENIFCFVEIPVENIERATKFYSKILAIELKSVEYAGAEMTFFPNEKGIVSGALIKDKSYKPSSEGVLVYLNGGEDLNNILLKVQQHGGQILLNKTKVSENHYYGIFKDSEGNRIALFSRK